MAVMSVTRARNPRGQGERLRHDLLDAAAELLAEHGTVEAVSLRSVATRAGVSPTAVYRHFDDHASLMASAIRHCWNEFTSAITIDPTDEPDPFERFRLMGDAYVLFASEHAGKYRVIFSKEVTDQREKEDSTMEAFGLLVAVVTELLEINGDDRDPFFVSTQVHTWIHGIVDLCTNHPDMPFPEAKELVAHLPFDLRLTPAE